MFPHIHTLTPAASHFPHTSPNLAQPAASLPYPLYYLPNTRKFNQTHDCLFIQDKKTVYNDTVENTVYEANLHQITHFI